MCPPFPRMHPCIGADTQSLPRTPIRGLPLQLPQQPVKVYFVTDPKGKGDLCVALLWGFSKFLSQ